MTAILDLFKRMPEGIPQHVVPAELAGTPASVQRDAVNRLLKDKKIQLQMSANDSNTFVYKEVEAGSRAWHQIFSWSTSVLRLLGTLVYGPKT